MSGDSKNNMRAENDPEVLRGKLNLETARIPWRDLQRFFAAGRAVFVDPQVSLVDAAAVISEDNKPQVEQWLATGQLGRVTDRQAEVWQSADTQMWAVVVKPWVLVQPLA